MTRRTSLGYALASSAAVALALLGLWWFIAPMESARWFGVPLPEDNRLSFAYVKGMQDIIAAILIGLFVVRRDRRGTVLVLLGVIIVPIGDLLAVARAGASAGDIWPVNVAIAAAVAAGILLLGRADELAESHSRPVPAWMPRTPGKVAVLVVGAVMFAAIAFGFPAWWLTDPAGLSADFGAELSGSQFAYAYVKGLEDLFVAIIAIMFMLRRKRTELILVLAVSLLIVIGDQLAHTLAGYFDPSMFVAHVSYLVVIGSVLAALRTNNAARPQVAGRPSAQRVNA